MVWTVGLVVGAVAMATLVVLVLVGLFEVLDEAAWPRPVRDDARASADD